METPVNAASTQRLRPVNRRARGTGVWNYALLRRWHRWLGLASLLLIVTSSVTGLGLLLKKDFAFLQPPTQRGVANRVSGFISIERAIESALASGHEDFQTPADIDRIDVRPEKGVFKVRSVSYSEVQVDATTGAVLSSGRRVSDVLEALHDGSLVGAWMHDLVMPGYALALLAMAATGALVWYLPWKLRRQRARTPPAQPGANGANGATRATTAPAASGADIGERAMTARRRTRGSRPARRPPRRDE